MRFQDRSPSRRVSCLRLRYVTGQTESSWVRFAMRQATTCSKR